MKSILVSLAVAALAQCSVILNNRDDGNATWLSYEDMDTRAVNDNQFQRRYGSEQVTCYDQGTTADRAPLSSNSRHMGRQVNDGHKIQTRYDYGEFTVLVSGEAINGCNFVVDDNCSRLLQLPIEQCNTDADSDGKQGGYETDLCGQWRLDPGANGQDF
ncbi:hypothetical protein MKEN_01150700 [Mycena kentingensis (nom. inval.)]|nr:hypothetical protein MKEN_01150700 [Mycena kentingensis (nom. inval.)]